MCHWPSRTFVEEVRVFYSWRINAKKARTFARALLKIWRWGGDSNPRYVAVYTLSRRAPSATRTPHQIFAALPHGGQRGATIGSWSKTVKKNLFRLICLVTQWTHDSFARDYGRMRSDQLFIKSYEGNMRVKKYQSTHFFRVTCNSLILFITILTSRKRVWTCDFVIFNSKSIG